MKTSQNREWKILHTVFERWALCFHSYKNRELKVKLWLAGARGIQASAFFVPFILPERHFLALAFYLNV